MDPAEGPSFSGAAWNDIDNTLLETFNFKASYNFEAARDAAFFNLDTGRKLIRLNNNKNRIEFAKNEIKKRGIKDSSLDSLKAKQLIELVMQLQETPKNQEEARAMLESRPQIFFDKRMERLDKLSRDKNFKGPWLLVKIGCLNYEKARILLDGWEWLV
jgi:hypothetical protein